MMIFGGVGVGVGQVGELGVGLVRAARGNGREPDGAGAVGARRDR